MLGLSTNEFLYGLTWADFQIKSYFHSDKVKNEYRTSWEQKRALAQIIISSQGSKENMHEIWPFVWDKKQKAKVVRKTMSASEIEEITKRYNT